MATFSFYVLPYSYKVEGSLLPRGKWNLFKIYWFTTSKAPIIFEEHTKPNESWISTTVLYNSNLKSVDDPFGWNKAIGIPEKTMSLIKKALEVSSRVAETGT
jgi:hypothetical protein